MTEYRSTRELAVDPEVAFDYLSDVEKLPRYFPRIVEARSTGEDRVSTTAVLGGEDVGSDAATETVQGEAWFRTDDATNSVEWGAEGPNDYHGSLVVTPSAVGSSVAISLHTTAEHPGVQDGLEETLDAIVAALA